jgi:hypothetical protein
VICDERVRHCVATNGSWLAAIDAVELALNIPPEGTDLQRQLGEQLMDIVGCFSFHRSLNRLRAITTNPRASNGCRVCKLGPDELDIS